MACCYYFQTCAKKSMLRCARDDLSYFTFWLWVSYSCSISMNTIDLYPDVATLSVLRTIGNGLNTLCYTLSVLEAWASTYIDSAWLCSGHTAYIEVSAALSCVLLIVMNAIIARRDSELNSGVDTAWWTVIFMSMLVVVDVTRKILQRRVTAPEQG